MTSGLRCAILESWLLGSTVMPTLPHVHTSILPFVEKLITHRPNKAVLALSLHLLHTLTLATFSLARALFVSCFLLLAFCMHWGDVIASRRLDVLARSQLLVGNLLCNLFPTRLKKKPEAIVSKLKKYLWLFIYIISSPYFEFQDGVE